MGQDLLLTGDSGDLREGELQQNLLLVIDHIHPGPVDSDDDVVLGQIWTWKYNSSSRFITAGRKNVVNASLGCWAAHDMRVKMIKND